MSTRIDTELMITGTGEAIRDASIVIEGNKITYAGENEHAPKGDKVISSPVIMPGMWDVHTHFIGIHKPSVEAVPFVDQKLAVLRSIWDVREMLKSGFTSAREVGGYGIELNKAISEGVIVGPRIYSAGMILSTTGGHGDIHNLPLDMVTMMNNEGLGILCDGVAECIKAVRIQLRHGAEVIKYCASGGVMSKIDNPMHQQFSDKEQRAIVAEARLSEVAVAAHCHGAAGIRAALDAGVKTIDHGTFLDEKMADTMLEKDAIMVPTRYVIEKLIANAADMGVPDYAVAKIHDLADQHHAAMKIAIRRGVKIATGTDMFVSGPGNIFTYGENALELKHLVDAGMSEMDAIVAATKHGPLTLGPRAPKSGILKEGYDADLLLLTKNPLDNIEVLLDRDNISSVIKQGKIAF